MIIGIAICGVALAAVLAAPTQPAPDNRPAVELPAFMRAAGAVTARPCFGAASRDPLRRCSDAVLRDAVAPPPSDAALVPNAECRPTGQLGLLYPCWFGPEGDEGDETIALVGDSHATHWRGAVEVVAQQLDRPAVSLARSHCPFIAATPKLPRAEQAECMRWNSELLAWLAAHPEVRTLFISHRLSGRFESERGRDEFETQVEGHMRRWRELPPSVANVVVIRDTPRSSVDSTICVVKRIIDKRSLGQACGRARRDALRPDPALEAVRRLQSPRVHGVDLSPQFCDRKLCYPVVGGAFVYKDSDHINAVFAHTLGPFLARAYEQIVRDEHGTPLTQLDGDERAAAQCLIGERLLAARAGGFDAIEDEREERADACRERLESQAAALRDAGDAGERLQLIERVLDPEH